MVSSECQWFVCSPQRIYPLIINSICISADHSSVLLSLPSQAQSSSSPNDVEGSRIRANHHSSFSGISDNCLRTNLLDHLSVILRAIVQAFGIYDKNKNLTSKNQ